MQKRRNLCNGCGVGSSLAKTHTAARIAIPTGGARRLYLLSAPPRRRNALRWGKKWRDRDLIFCTRYGGAQTDGYIGNKWFKKILKDAGIRDVTFHTLRKTSGSLLLQESGDLKEVQVHLRHSRIETTANVYATVYKGTRRASLTRIEAKIAS